MNNIYAYGQPSDGWDGLGVFFFWLIIGILAIVLILNMIGIGIKNNASKKKLPVLSVIKISFFGVFIAVGLWAGFETINFDKKPLDYFVAIFLIFIYFIIMKLTIDRELAKS